MKKFIVQVIIGLPLILIGIFNIKGNISMLHSYHRKNLKEKDVIPFGKKVGMGSIIVGISIISAGIFSILNCIVISNIIIIVGLIIGIVLIFYALFKYNNGIF